MRTPAIRRTPVSIFACALLLAACGGGATGSSSTPAPTALSYPSAPALVVGETIAPLIPAVTGTVTSFSVTPALPAGLSLNVSTGVVSGTPAAVTPKTQYRVTASNAGGSTSTALSLTVNDKPPGIAYASSYYSFTAGIASRALAPVITGGAVTVWSTDPALPAGLALDTQTGIISGTPTAASPAGIYTVTAANSGGSATSTLTLAVSAAPLLDLGHVASISYLGFSSDRVLSQDTTGHWALWNYANDQELATGAALAPGQLNSNQPPVALAGSTAVIQTASTLTVLNASTGTVEGTITATPAWWQLALDGSYVCAGSSAGLTVWTPGGQPLISLPGDYSKALALAAHGVLEIALGPASGVIQTVNVLTGTVSQSPAYQGTFGSWFLDGSGFLTSVGSGTTGDPATIFVYSSAGTQQEILGSAVVQLSNPPDLGGDGSWFWTCDGSNLNVYAVGGTSAPALTTSCGGPILVASGQTLAVLSDSSIGIIDLSGVAPAYSTATLPIRAASAFAAVSSATWIVGNSSGVLLDGASIGGAPRYLDYGQVQGIAGSAGDFAVATASGRIIVYSSASNAIGTTIDLMSTQLALSADGSVLAASVVPPYAPSTSINAYNLPATTPANSINLGSAFPQSLSASGTGSLTQLGLTFDTLENSPCLGEVIAVTATTPSWCTTSGAPSQILISPNGTQVAVVTGPQPFSNASTTVYTNGTLSTAVAASALGWLDDTTFLANEFVPVSNGLAYSYSAAVIFNAGGSALASPPLPYLDGIQVLTATSIYAANPNVIFALPGATALWQSGSPVGNDQVIHGPGLGVISGGEAIFPSANFLLAEPVPTY